MAGKHCDHRCQAVKESMESGGGQPRVKRFVIAQEGRLNYHSDNVQQI